MIVGKARSASVTARPQVGIAGQAIDQRRTVETCSTVAIPYSSSSASISGRQAGSRSVSRIDCWQVSRAGVRYFSKNARRPLDQPEVALVLDPAVLDRDAQEELAVPLLVPAEVVVHVRRPCTGFGSASGVAEVLLDLGPEGGQAPVVDDVLEPGPLAVGAVAEVAEDLEHRLADLEHVVAVDVAERHAQERERLLALGVVPRPPPTSTL